MNAEDYLKVLGLKPDATPEQIRKAYRSLAYQYHPDRNPGDKSAEERFKRINEANEYLSNQTIPPKPVAEPSSLDFGALYEDSVSSLKLTIHNHGGKVQNEPDIGLSNKNSWFTCQPLSRRSADEGYCPFELEITADGKRLKELNRTNEWLEIELDGVKVHVDLQARTRVRKTAPPQQRASSSRTITYTTGQQKQEAKPFTEPEKKRPAEKKVKVQQPPREQVRVEPTRPTPQKQTPPTPRRQQKRPISKPTRSLGLRTFVIGSLLVGVAFTFTKCGAVLNYLQRNTPGQVEQRERAQEIKNVNSAGHNSRKSGSTKGFNEPSRSQDNAPGTEKNAKPSIQPSSTEAPRSVQQSPATPASTPEIIQLPHRLSAAQCAERKAARKRGEYPYIPPECNEP